MSLSSKRDLHIGVVDFFCGCGGASYGFSRASASGVNVEIIAGIDIDQHCCATYTRMLGIPGLQLDIASIASDKEKLSELLKQWDLSRFDKVILIGCAPCQGFAAHRKAIIGEDQRRNLFVAFCTLAQYIKPDAIFMENVPDLFSKGHWQYYSQGRELLEAAGFHVRSRIYNFAGFGLPQERFRAVMMAFPYSFNMPKPLFDHDSFRTVRQAIGNLPPLKSGESCPSDLMHVVSKHRQETLNTLAKVPLDGGNRPIGVGPACLDRTREKHGGYTDVYGRLAWDRPAVTITGRCRTPSCGRFAHPEQNRGLSIREAALLQGFPLEFYFEGPFDDKYKQIGNAVPPLVAQVIAEHIIDCLRKGATTQIIGAVQDITQPVGPGFAITINGIKRARVEVNNATP